MKSLILILALAFVCRAAPPHPSIPKSGTLDGLGVSIHFTEPLPGELEMIRAAGFRWIRVDILWSETEKERGVYDFAVFDRFVTALEKAGLKALFILDYGNPLYGEPGEEFPFTKRATAEEFRAGYAKWCAAVVKRYAGKGYLWELWNEPNLPAFWQPQPDVQQYIPLAKAAAQAIRGAAPGEAIIGPATAGIDYAFPFLEACFQAGLLDLFDAVSVHTYRKEGPESVADELRRLRLLIARHAPAGKTIPILCSEWGYSTANPDPSVQWAQYLADEATQAKYFARLVLTNVANDVPLTIWYDWRDDGDNPNDEQHRFGLVRHAHRPKAKQPFEPKPAYLAAKTLTQQLAGLTFSKRLQLPTYGAPPYPELMLFTGADREVLVGWHGEAGRGEAALPLGREPVAAVDHLGKAAAKTATTKSGPARGTLDDGPRFFSPTKRDPVLRLAAAWPRVPLERVAAAPVEEVVDLSFANPLDQPVRMTGGAADIAQGA